MRTRTQVLVTGLALGESPRWHDRRLWFADWPDHEIGTVDPAGNRASVMPMPGLPFSFDWLADGRLIVVTNADGRRLQRREPDGHLRTPR